MIWLTNWVPSRWLQCNLWRLKKSYILKRRILGMKRSFNRLRLHMLVFFSYLVACYRSFVKQLLRKITNRSCASTLCGTMFKERFPNFQVTSLSIAFHYLLTADVLLLGIQLILTCDNLQDVTDLLEEVFHIKYERTSLGNRVWTIWTPQQVFQSLSDQLRQKEKTCTRQFCKSFNYITHLFQFTSRSFL